MSVIKVNNKSLYVAALSHYTACLHEAKAHLDLCFNNTVAIGDHTDLLAEVKRWTRNLAEAEENLSILKNHFTEPPAVI